MNTLKSLFLASRDIAPRTAHWAEFEQLLIEATLAFANMAREEITEEGVDALFDPFADDLTVLARPKKGAALLGTVQRRPILLTSHFIHSRTKSAYKSQQKELRDALYSMVTKGTVEKALQKRLDKRLADIAFRLGIINDNFVYRFSVETVAAGWALGIVVLLDGDYPLKQCEVCNQYFATFKPKEHPRRYCLSCADVRRKKSAATRQKKWRNRRKRGK